MDEIHSFYKNVISWVKAQNFFRNPNSSIKNFLFLMFSQPQNQFFENATAYIAIKKTKYIYTFENLNVRCISCLPILKSKYFEGTSQICFSMCTMGSITSLMNLFILPLFSQPCELSYFFLNFGLISASASYKGPSYKKECISHLS